MKITVDLGELKQTIADIRSASSQISEIRYQLEKRMSHLFTNLPQETNEKGIQKAFGEWQQQINNYSNTLNKIADDLQLVDDRFREAQE